MLYGFAAGVLLQRYGPSSRSQVLARIGILAALCFAGGLATAEWMPPNKRLLTPAFVLLATGTALAVFCVIYLLVDVARGNAADGRPRPGWTWPFIALGRNALIVFVAERFLLQTARRVHIGDRVDLQIDDDHAVGAAGEHSPGARLALWFRQRHFVAAAAIRYMASADYRRPNVIA